MLETSNLARKYTPIRSFRKCTFQCLGQRNFADISICLQKISVCSPKKYLYSKQQCESCVRDILVLFSVSVRQKVTITKNITLQTLCPESGLRTAPNWPKFRKMTMTSRFSDITSALVFLTLFCFSCQVQLLVQFHVNIITGSGIMTISSYNGLTRNPEIGNTPV